MTTSNSKTWNKLNQIDCESRFNLNVVCCHDFLIIITRNMSVPYPNQH